ncbi:hypothetical protein DUNSADRAFT_7136 [Dunaliella salina]|uniref:Encoded protein n=1 Tax=Dunaliella salina TaxID=3046 RepID=A0ABQ7GLZ8_DUNSA|nr:hypothetical protein DUNSADRAFT_7136 [Dunaliella salina]|eukprot:KAF5835634.1 hypothetical protein DUNSADRAFT_7136 [Dunaliella salina]
MLSLMVTGHRLDSMCCIYGRFSWCLNALDLLSNLWFLLPVCVAVASPRASCHPEFDGKVLLQCEKL